MNKLFTLLAAVLLVQNTNFAQSPQKMSYQAVIRNNSNQLVTEHAVGMKISILKGSETGTAVFVERHTPTTNLNGLATIVIGTGTLVSGNFSTINWGNDIYFIKTETDVNGGTAYTITNTSQLLSVPYALYAKTAEVLTEDITETDPVYSESEAANITTTDITNLSNLSGINTGDQDLSGLATNEYVDELLARIIALEESFTDSRDGIHYKAVKIGDQIWMAENLKYLPSVNDAVTGSLTDSYYYVYGYSGFDITAAKATANFTTYGVLYNWPAAMNGQTSSTSNPSGVQGVCPSGWHLPSDAEWTELSDYLGGVSVAGGKLKETGLTHWTTPNTLATNDDGFTALPGGYRSSGGTFDLIGLRGLWWSCTYYSATGSWNRELGNDHSAIPSGGSNKGYGQSIRCIKD